MDREIIINVYKRAMDALFGSPPYDEDVFHEVNRSDGEWEIVLSPVPIPISSRSLLEKLNIPQVVDGKIFYRRLTSGLVAAFLVRVSMSDRASKPTFYCPSKTARNHFRDRISKLGMKLPKNLVNPTDSIVSEIFTPHLEEIDLWIETEEDSDRVIVGFVGIPSVRYSFLEHVLIKYGRYLEDIEATISEDVPTLRATIRSGHGRHELRPRTIDSILEIREGGYKRRSLFSPSRET